MSESTTKLGAVLARIDEVNAADPRLDATADGAPVAKELLYGRRMTSQLQRLDPNASPALQIACRGQHIARWRWPRSEFPEGRAGYKAWRRELYARHAQVVTQIMTEEGFGDDERRRVEELLGKQNRTTDEESQLLEDVACLVFLEFEFEAFAAKHERDKLIRIVKKTWQKMSEKGRAAALELDLPGHLAGIVKEALA